MPHRVSIMNLTNTQAQRNSFKVGWDKDSNLEHVLKFVPNLKKKISKKSNLKKFQEVAFQKF